MMSLSAETFIVISLMLAVFSAVAAIGTSVVLGVGFERLRAGFEIVKKQTGFFADAIHKLDQRTELLDEQQGDLKEYVSNVSTRVDRVEKQTGFFFESLNSLEAQILKGSPAQEEVSVIKTSERKRTSKKRISSPSLPKVMEWSETSDVRHLLQANQDIQEKILEPEEKKVSNGITSSFISYLFSDNAERSNGVIYH